MTVLLQPRLGVSRQVSDITGLRFAKQARLLLIETEFGQAGCGQRAGSAL